MNISIDKFEAYSVLRIDGELDATSAILLDNAFNEVTSENIKKILIDCERLTYISSPGIGVLTSHIEDDEHQNTQIVLFGMSERIRSIFVILGLDSIIPIVPTEDDAKRNLGYV